MRRGVICEMSSQQQQRERRGNALPGGKRAEEWRNVRGYLVDERRTVAAGSSGRVLNSPERREGRGGGQMTLGRGLQNLAKMTAIKQKSATGGGRKEERGLRFEDTSSSSTLSMSASAMQHKRAVGGGKKEERKLRFEDTNSSTVPSMRASGNGKMPAAQQQSGRGGGGKKDERGLSNTTASSKLSDDYSSRVPSTSSAGRKTIISVSGSSVMELKRAGYSVSSRGTVKKTVADNDDEEERFVRFVDTSNSSTNKRKLVQQLENETNIQNNPSNESVRANITNRKMSGYIESDKYNSSSDSVSENVSKGNRNGHISSIQDKYSMKPQNNIKARSQTTRQTVKETINPFKSDKPSSEITHNIASENRIEPTFNSEIPIGTNDMHKDTVIDIDIQKLKDESGSDEIFAPPVMAAVQNGPVRHGEVSNNFVRASLSKRGLYRQKGGKNKASRLLKARSRELRRAHEEQNENVAYDTSLDNFEKSKNSDEHQENAHLSNNQNFGGLSAIGLDPLQLSLDAIKPNLKSKTELPPTSDSAVDSLPNAATQPSTFIDCLKKTFGSRYKPARGTFAPNSVFGKQTTRKMRQKGSHGVQCSDDFLQASEAAPPLCSGHHMPAKLLTVKKAGGNKGRKFFGCSFPSEQRCGFFLWLEDNPNVADILSTAHTSSRGQINKDNRISKPVSVSESPLEVWLKFALDSYKRKLEDFDVLELKSEILQCNRQFKLAKKFNYPEYCALGTQAEMSLSGRRGDLMDKVLNAAFIQLCLSFGLQKEVTELDSGEFEKAPNKKRKHTSVLSCSGDSDESHFDDDDDNDFDSDSDEDGDSEDDSDIDCDDDVHDKKNEDVDRVFGDDNSESREKENELVSESMIELTSDDDSDINENYEKGVEMSDVDCDDNSYGTASSFGDDDLQCDDIDTSAHDEDIVASNFKNISSSHVNDIKADYSERNINKVLRCTFGHEELRPGQLWAVQRVLGRKRSLLVLPTGAGKSLTYLLPSILMNRSTHLDMVDPNENVKLSLSSLTLVVSPLVSLMQDQMRKLPAELPCGCFSGGLTSVEAAMLTEAVLQGNIKVLFVSPERLCMPSFRQLMKTLQDKRRWNEENGNLVQSGGVGLLCVDEAHCLSQWSFNFRPAFLRIKKELEFVQPLAVLALTATAPRHVQKDIMQHLGITQDGVLSFPPRRPNLLLNAIIVNDEDDRRKKVVDEVLGKHDEKSHPEVCLQNNTKSYAGEEIYAHDFSDYVLSNSSVVSKRRKVSLNTPPVNSSNVFALLPTIVYVWRRDEADSMADYLKSQGVSAAAYHAGMERAHRARVQLMFNKGSLSVVVATVAFGMGIDKSNVRRVIHSSLPKSVENYVQEVGRAGRDGDPAKCTLMLSKNDVVRHHALSYSQSLSTLQVMSLFRRVFVPKSSQHSSVFEFDSEVAINLDRCAKESDFSGALAETLFSVLELPPFQLCLVDGVRYDVLKGRIQSNPASSLRKLTGTSLFPGILREICRLNTLSASKSETSSIGDPFPAKKEQFSKTTDESDFAIAYAGGLEFELSLLALARAVNIRVDKLTGMLWGMQCSGLISYSLSGSAIYLTVKADGRNVDAIEGNQCPCLDCWLLSLAEQVKLHVTRISQEASDRILDMWRMGSVIESKKNDEFESCLKNFSSIAQPSCTDSMKQDALMEFLCHYMDNMASVSTTGKDAPMVFEPKIDKSESQSAVNDRRKNLLSSLRSKFYDMALPVMNMYPPIQASEKARYEHCRRQCLILAKDPEITTITTRLNSLVEPKIDDEVCKPQQIASLEDEKQATHQVSCTIPKTRQVRMKKLLKEYQSLLIARVLHGLGSSMMPTDLWRDRCSSHWESCRDLAFNVVKEIADSAL